MHILLCYTLASVTQWSTVVQVLRAIVTLIFWLKMIWLTALHKNTVLIISCFRFINLKNWYDQNLPVSQTVLALQLVPHVIADMKKLLHQSLCLHLVSLKMRPKRKMQPTLLLITPAYFEIEMTWHWQLLVVQFLPIVFGEWFITVQKFPVYLNKLKEGVTWPPCSCALFCFNSSSIYMLSLFSCQVEFVKVDTNFQQSLISCCSTQKPFQLKHAFVLFYSSCVTSEILVSSSCHIFDREVNATIKNK